MKKIIFTYILSTFFVWSYNVAVASNMIKIKGAVEVVSNTNPQVEISAYPNPFKEMVNLKIFTNNCVPTTLKVYDLIGVEKMHIDLDEFSNHNGGYEIQIKDLSEGIYFCNIYSHDKLLDSKKIICTK